MRQIIMRAFQSKYSELPRSTCLPIFMTEESTRGEGPVVLGRSAYSCFFWKCGKLAVRLLTIRYGSEVQ